MYSIGQLAKWAGLSRSTLLYYDEIGLLKPACRAENGYRYYSAKDKSRLEQILLYRQAGLSLERILALCSAPAAGLLPQLLHQQLHELNQQMSQLRQQQRVVLRLMGTATKTQIHSKEQWTNLLRQQGLSEQDMQLWHQEFERSMPQAHQQFLESLMLDPVQIQQIRAWSRGC